MASLIAGSALAIAMGVILGLIGGGGSILTLPLLVYFFGFSTSVAIHYSLFAVGVAASAGTALAARERTVDLRAMLIFSPVSSITVFTIRRFLMPRLPVMLDLGLIRASLDDVLLVLFAVVMLASSASMIRHKQRRKASSGSAAPSHLRLALIAAGVGSVTGTVGAGGGFLFVPSLIFFASLSTRKAVGTSLAIIMANSFVGFAGGYAAGIPTDWGFLLPFSLLPIMGIFLGRSFSARISNRVLKSLFGWFVLVTGTLIIASEFVRS